MASIVNSKLYYAMLQIAKSENIGSRLQFASIAGCRTRSVEIYRVVFAWCKLLAYSAFSFVSSGYRIDSAVSLYKNIQIPYKGLQTIKPLYKLKPSGNSYAKYFDVQTLIYSQRLRQVANDLPYSLILGFTASRNQ